MGIVQYRMGQPNSIDGWQQKIGAYLHQAASTSSTVVVLPELFSLEGLWLIRDAATNLPKATREFAKTLTPHFKKQFALWSKELGITIVAGSWPEADAARPDDIYNTAWVFGPDGKLIHAQKKNHLTHDETSLYHWRGAKGGMQTFSLPDGTLAGVAICFDSEFPNFISITKDPIPEVIFVPSMTGDAFGRFRVRRSASARAVEHHAYVVVTGTVGGDGDDPLIGAHEGQAAVFSPSDLLFPANGVLAEGKLNQSDVVAITLDLKKLRQSRERSTTFPAKKLQEEIP